MPAGSSSATTVRPLVEPTSKKAEGGIACPAPPGALAPGRAHPHARIPRRGARICRRTPEPLKTMETDSTQSLPRPPFWHPDRSRRIAARIVAEVDLRLVTPVSLGSGERGGRTHRPAPTARSGLGPSAPDGRDARRSAAGAPAPPRPQGRRAPVRRAPAHGTPGATKAACKAP